jgi:ATP-dependent DNA helicase RecQ
VADAELDPAAAALFDKLRAYRLEVARKEQVAAFMVASDRCLRDIARLRPRNRGELLLAHGIGPAKADRYGDGLLGIVRNAASISRASESTPLLPGASPP